MLRNTPSTSILALTMLVCGCDTDAQADAHEEPAAVTLAPISTVPTIAAQASTEHATTVLAPVHTVPSMAEAPAYEIALVMAPIHTLPAIGDEHVVQIPAASVVPDVQWPRSSLVDAPFPDDGPAGQPFVAGPARYDEPLIERDG